MTLLPILTINLILLIITILLIAAEYLLVNYGECDIVINKERYLKIQGGGNLLECLSINKIFIPSACGAKATCGYCKVKILSGAGVILPTEEVYIREKEQSEGIRLACQVKIKNNIEIYIPEYILETKEYNVRVENIRDLTHDIKQINFKLLEPDVMEFKPGQYIQIKVPGTEEFRAYSIASSPSQNGEIELIVRLVPGGLCSTYIHKVLEAGNEEIFTGPFGDFFLNEDSTKNIICIGGGCGMAPIRSILLHLAEREMPIKVTFFFGARAKEDLFFTEELRSMEKKYPNFKYVPALSEPKTADKWDGEVGLITQVMEKSINEDISDLEAYLCGPPPMIEAAFKVLTKKGMTEKYIRYDEF